MEAEYTIKSPKAARHRTTLSNTTSTVGRAVRLVGAWAKEDKALNQLIAPPLVPERARPLRQQRPAPAVYSYQTDPCWHKRVKTTPHLRCQSAQKQSARPAAGFAPPCGAALAWSRPVRSAGHLLRIIHNAVPALPARPGPKAQNPAPWPTRRQSTPWFLACPR